MEKAYLITQNTDLTRDFSSYERFYIWDSFCEHNLFYFIEDEQFIKKIIKLDKSITLTTPILSEQWIKKLFIFIKKIQNIKWFEIVINDYWVFYKLKKNFPNIKTIWWNFLSWQSKDPYLKIFKNKEIHKNFSIDSNFYKNLLEKNNIENIELYNTFQWFNNKQDYNIHLQFPFVIYSITRYCSSNLIENKIDYLSVVENCDWCKQNVKNNLNLKLDLNWKKINNYYIWNKQFYENNNLEQNPKIKRIIYNYDLLENDW